jgi:excisionase family DNA binding protein
VSKITSLPFQNANERLAVSPTQAAVLAGIGRTKLYEALNSGILPSFKIGTRRLVRVAEIEAWLLRLEDSARPHHANLG